MSHRGTELLQRLRAGVVVGDGAIGTQLSERGHDRSRRCEWLNLSEPDAIRAVHAAYVEAGAELIETNTYAANRTKLGSDASAADGVVAEVNRVAVALAREASAGRAFVAGAVGPLTAGGGTALTEDEARAAFREQILALAEAGADALLFETFADLPQLLLAVALAKAETDLPVVAQMVFQERGHTLTGVHVLAALEALVAAGADVVGTNCGKGVSCVVQAAELMARSTDLPVSAFPNAGLPVYADGQYRFGAPMPYMVDAAERMAAAGVSLIGGCCGTTPEYVRRVAERIGGKPLAARVRVEPVAVAVAEVPAVPSRLPPTASLLYDLPSAPRFYGVEPAPARGPLVVVEIDPPRGLNFAAMVRRAQQLRDMGVDAITVADNPVATLHMGNLAFAEIVQKEAGVPVILHIACRDANLLGLQSRLLEAHVRGVRTVLALTGDPAKVGDTPGATSVYDLNSLGLVELVAKFNRGVSHGEMALGGRTEFTIGVAFDPNTPRLAPAVDKLRRKVANGAHFAMTQPMYDPGRFVEMTAAVAPLATPVFVGIMPLLSERNAEFLHNEVPGIRLTEDVRNRMKGFAGKDGRRMGNRIAMELIDAMHPTADAFYLIPPQRFTEMAVELVAHIHSKAGVAASA